MSFFQTFKLTVFNVNLDIIIFIIFRESTKLITDATVYTNCWYQFKWTNLSVNCSKPNLMVFHLDNMKTSQSYLKHNICFLNETYLTSMCI